MTQNIFIFLLNFIPFFMSSNYIYTLKKYAIIFIFRIYFSITIFILPLILNICYAQTDTLKFEQIDKKKSGSTLFLMSNGNCIYNDFSLNCRFQYDLVGTWRKNNDKIIITFINEWEKSENEYVSNYAVIVLKDKNEQPLPNIEIDICRSSKNKISILSDQNGKAIIYFNEESKFIFINFKTKTLKMKIQKSKNHIEIIEQDIPQKKFFISKTLSKEVPSTQGILKSNVVFLLKNDKLYYQNTFLEGNYMYEFQQWKWNNFKKYIDTNE